MATRSLGVLSLDLVAKIGGFEAGMDKAARSSEKRLKEIQATAKKVGAGIGLAFAGVATGLGALVKNALDTADELGNLSEKTGIAVEQLSALQFAAEQSDVSAEAFSQGLVKLNDSINQAAAGAKTQSTAFAALGVSVRDTEGKIRNTHDVLLDIATAFSRSKDGAGKTAIALDLLGRAGADLIPFFNAGASGIEAFEEQARKLGVTISGKTAAAADQFDKNLKVLKATFKGVGFSIAEDLAPRLADLSSIVQDPKFAEGLRRIVGLGVSATEAVARLVQKFGEVGKKREIDNLTGQIAGLQDQIDRDQKTGGLRALFGADVQADIAKHTKAIEEARARLAQLQSSVSGFSPDVSGAKGLESLFPPEAASSLDDYARMLAEVEARTKKVKEVTDEAAEAVNDWAEEATSVFKAGAELPGLDVDQTLNEARDKYVKNQEDMTEALRDQEALRQQIMEDGIAAGSDALGLAAEAASAFGKKGFKAFKALAIAQTVIDTYKGAQAIFATLAAVPGVGPFLAPAGAAAAVAAGLSRVAQIKGMEPNGFMEGGYTGNGGISDIAGVVHGQEFVVPAPHANRYRPELEAMKAGKWGGGSGGLKVENYGEPLNVRLEGTIRSGVLKLMPIITDTVDGAVADGILKNRSQTGNAVATKYGVQGSSTR